MRIAIMQPTCLPWLGYFDLMDQVEQFVLLDDVQFEKRSWQQRNRIKTPNGLMWITVPVIVHGRFEQKINEVKINESGFWKKHSRAIELNYRKAPYFDCHFEELLPILERSGNLLVDLNVNLIEWLSQTLLIETTRKRSSNLNVRGNRSRLLAEICESVGANEYLSPLGSADYLLGELYEFENRSIQVFFQNYVHPTYNQRFPPFVPFASVLDLIFNEGARSLEIIRSGRRKPYLPDEIRPKVRIGTHQ